MALLKKLPSSSSGEASPPVLQPGGAARSAAAVRRSFQAAEKRNGKGRSPRAHRNQAPVSPLDDVVKFEVSAITSDGGLTGKVNQELLKKVSREVHDLISYVALCATHAMNTAKRSSFREYDLDNVPKERIGFVPVDIPDNVSKPLPPRFLRLLRDRYLNGERASPGFFKRLSWIIYSTIKLALQKPETLSIAPGKTGAKAAPSRRTSKHQTELSATQPKNRPSQSLVGKTRQLSTGSKSLSKTLPPQGSKTASPLSARKKKVKPQTPDVSLRSNSHSSLKNV